MLKVKEDSFPFPRWPLSHSPERSGGTPAVAVCDAVSRFTHVTVVPTCIVKFSSAKSNISDFKEFSSSDEVDARGVEVASTGMLVEVWAVPVTSVGSGAEVGAAEASVEGVSLPQATSAIPTITAATNT